MRRNSRGSPRELERRRRPPYVSEFFATTDGLALTKAFMRIKEPGLRRRIVHLVEEIALIEEIAGDDLS